jgi:Na+(H+)/acetate symporter ActP
MSFIPLLFVIAITVVTVGMGIWATKSAHTAGDFFVAGRSVSAIWNASAISGEYLSAASFMGIAGLLMKNGYDVLWYPVCYAAGYLFLLLFIAGPLRRFGAYTIPDFAEGRFDSPLFRKIAVTFVLFIGFFYTMPQMKGAGITMNTILNWPYFVGILIVGSVITFNVALGGMKGITIVQAFQYWVKVFAISLPVFILMSTHGTYNGRLGENAAEQRTSPRLERDAPIQLKGKKAAPNNVVAFSTSGATAVSFPKGVTISKVTTSRPPIDGEDPMPDNVLRAVDSNLTASQFGKGNVASGDSVVAITRGGKPYSTKTPVTFMAASYSITKKGVPIRGEDGRPVKNSPKIEIAEDTDATLIEGAFAPNAPANGSWLNPFGPLVSKRGFPLLYTYSLIIALVCGTAGLPHILVRFYTNPDGRAAKKTTLYVMIMLGCFYIFPPMWGVLGRMAAPELYATGKTDSILIHLPKIMGGTMGDILSGITAAGAFAAFMSTFSGLLVSMSGAMAHDIYGNILKPNSTPEQKLKAFKIAAIVFGAVAMGLGLLVETFDINMMVGWAFAIAAASYFPLLLLGSWWRGLTVYGAAIGMLLGGLLSSAAIVVHMLIEAKVLSLELSPLVRTLLEQPAIWGVPLALTTMVVVSKMTSTHIPADINLKMLRLHAPEEMGLSKNYIADH